VRCGSRVVTARGLFAPPSLSQVTPQPATMAGPNKCLAPNNKPRHVSEATNE
jgi:hypothetical protein